MGAARYQACKLGPGEHYAVAGALVIFYEEVYHSSNAVSCGDCTGILQDIAFLVEFLEYAVISLIDGSCALLKGNAFDIDI